MSNLLSVVIIAKNEEQFIQDAIKSAQFADEVLLLDSGSIDKTCEIAKKLGARVENQVWLGFGPQKNSAIDLAINDWVFVLDSDERISPKLQKFSFCNTKASFEVLNQYFKHIIGISYLMHILNR